jgi:hypothetical protein
MQSDIEIKADRLAGDPRISDYDFWRILRNVNNEIFSLSSRKEPIPIDLIRWRMIVMRARAKAMAR